MLDIWIFRSARIAVTAFAALVAASPAFGSPTFPPDNSDIYNARGENGWESGWAVELVQSGSLVFATVFTYDSNMRPIWYSATLLAGLPTQAEPLAPLWIGDLYVTNGPSFGAPFDPSKVIYRKVGQMRYTQQGTGGGRVSLTIDGVTVVKQIERVTFQQDNFSGTYQVVSRFVAFNCDNPSDDGTYYGNATYTVTQTPDSFTVVTSESDGNSCTFTGNFAQNGRFASSLLGFHRCTNGTFGFSSFNEISVTPTDIRAGFDRSNQTCEFTGSFVGVRK